MTTPASAPAATARPIALTVAFWLWVVDAVRGLITGIALTIAIIYSTQAVVQLMLDLRG